VWNGSAWVVFFSTPGTASLSTHDINVQAVSYNDQSASCTARITIDTDKGLYAITTGNGDVVETEIDSVYYFGAENFSMENWLSADGDPSLWSCRAVPISGTPTVGSSATNTWLPMTEDRSWYVFANSNSASRSGFKSFQFTLQLALTSDTSNILASANMIVSASAQTDSGEIP
jgi:hypothetical protein